LIRRFCARATVAIKQRDSSRHAGSGRCLLPQSVRGDSGSRLLVGAHGDAQRIRNRPRPASADKGNAHAGLDQNLVTPHHALMQVDRSAFHHLWLGDDLEHVVHARGPKEVERHRAHDEGKTRRLLFGPL
jgi:hypothetical protein